MPSRRQFSAPLLAVLHHAKIVRIKAGSRHRFIGIWGVVVGGRLFVRSWSIKARSWYRTFLRDPRGFIKVGNRSVAVRAVRIRSARLKAAVDRAYLKKYDSGWEAAYAKDLAAPRSRATTTELRPA